MERSTIDFGIDLGTTNSCIAVIEGTQTKVIKNNEGAEITSSVVSFDKKSRLHIGQVAKNQLLSDDDNTASDVCYKFKTSMGERGPFYSFNVNGKSITREELSAEVLKQLKNDIYRSLGEEITTAVISVPAAFEIPQCSATDGAAKLAGLSFSPLIQEPVAAALAYGFQTTSNGVFWMVYDFGGGTFDAAIIQVRDEQIQVVNHGGDNHLGGGLIDREIVNQLLIPAVVKEFKITPESSKWGAITRTLEYYAEIGKIRLSIEEETDIEIPHLYKDNNGTSIPFEFELKRGDIEKLMEPFIERSINKCKAVLEEKKLTPSDIEKLILVGGPTLTPLFRQMLNGKLGITLESNKDPLTVVAQGAAIFAGTQVVPEKHKVGVSLTPDKLKVEIDYKPISDEIEPSIGGKIIASEGQSLQGYTIEFVEPKIPFRSGKIALNAEGAFIASVQAERERRNEYLIELMDEKGNLHDTIPDRFTYTIGTTVSAQPLMNNIGLALANGEVRQLFEKNTSLPATSKVRDIRTTAEVKRGDSGTFLRIPVVEGSNSRADRNTLIGYLEVTGQDQKVTRDLPIGSIVEVEVTINESRMIQMNAYVPMLDEDFDTVFDPQYPSFEGEELEDLAIKAKSRLEDIRSKLGEVESPDGENRLQQVDDKKLVNEIDSSLAAIHQEDKDARGRCQSRRIELDVMLDEIEELITWPTLVSEAEETISSGREIVTKFGDSQDNNDFSRLEETVEKAIASKNSDLLQQKVRNISQLVMEVLSKRTEFWVMQLERLATEHKDDMRNQAEADLLIAQGYKAINNNDAEALKQAVRQLYGLLPDSIAEDLRGYKSTIADGGF